MQKKQKRAWVPGILLTGGSALTLLVWLIMLFFSFLMGGSPGPDFGRSVPISYVAIIGLGFIGAGVGLVAGIMDLCGAKVPAALPILAALLGIAGSAPFFMLDIAAVGLFALAVGIASPAVYLLLTKIPGRTKRG